MAWVKVRGLEGLVYQAGHQPARERKHNCPDCLVCQMCSDTRCDQCLNRKNCQKRKRRKR